MLRLKLIHVSKKGASALSVGCFHQYQRITVSGTLCFEHILNIVADILQKTFSDAFSLIKIMIFDSNFKEGCSQGSSWQCTSTNSCLLLKSDLIWPQHKLIWDPGCPDFIENYIQKPNILKVNLWFRQPVKKLMLMTTLYSNVYFMIAQLIWIIWISLSTIREGPLSYH